MGDTPLYEIYEYDTTDAEGGLEDKSEYNEIFLMANGLDRQLPTPEVNDNYVSASVILPRGGNYSRKKFIGRKIDVSENSVGRRNYNPKLYTRKYRV